MNERSENVALPTEKLSHFSSEPVSVVRSVEQRWRYELPSEHEKPKGFWVSVDGEDDWASWCASEDFGIGQIRHNVVLAPNANILRCHDKLDVLCLTERYGIDIPGYSWSRKAIDWQRIASEYQGLIIAPYVWECRLNDECNWYYGWDCASGCIWDAAAIASVSEVRQQVAA